MFYSSQKRRLRIRLVAEGVRREGKRRIDHAPLDVAPHPMRLHVRGTLEHYESRKLASPQKLRRAFFLDFTRTTPEGKTHSGRPTEMKTNRGRPT